MPATNRSSPGAAQQGGTTDTVRLSINLGPAVADRLKDYTNRNGVTATEAIRRAISLLDFADSVPGARSASQHPRKGRDTQGGSVRCLTINYDLRWQP